MEQKKKSLRYDELFYSFVAIEYTIYNDRNDIKPSRAERHVFLYWAKKIRFV